LGIKKSQKKFVNILFFFIMEKRFCNEKFLAIGKRWYWLVLAVKKKSSAKNGLVEVELFIKRKEKISWQRKNDR